MFMQDTRMLLARNGRPTDDHYDPFKRDNPGGRLKMEEGAKGEFLFLFAFGCLVSVSVLCALKVVTSDQSVAVVVGLSGLISGFVIGKKT